MKLRNKKTGDTLDIVSVITQDGKTIDADTLSHYEIVDNTIKAFISTLSIGDIVVVYFNDDEDMWIFTFGGCKSNEIYYIDSVKSFNPRSLECTYEAYEDKDGRNCIGYVYELNKISKADKHQIEIYRRPFT